ncbi:MAG: ribonuclease Y [Ardenticatenaceae bacterium]|nr:ribonuclease Y [Ardenticatenaceae bacterium]
MPPLLMSIIWVVVGLLIGIIATLFAANYYYRTQLKPNDQKVLEEARSLAEKVGVQAEKEAETILVTARQEAKQIRKESDQAIERRYQDLARGEERLDRRQSSLDKQLKKIELREQNLNKRQSRLDRRQNEIDKLASSRMEELEKIAQLTQDEARQQLLELVEVESRQDMARVMREIELKAKSEAEDKARKFVAMAIQRVGGEHVSESTISVVELPNDEMKGRIIGRNGRNIRSFEQAAGVDVIVDDTPQAVTVSSFDPVRREVAVRALSKLVSDGRIHPARIEKLLNDAQKEVNRAIRKAGEDAAYEANVHGLHPEILKMLGRLRFRTSYGQNQLSHAVEASKISAILAAEMGANVDIAKMGGLLHDLGKAMDHDQEGTHAMLGAEYAKRFNVSAPVVNAIASHHHEVEQESVEAIIVEAADAISGARPGARRESMENYIKRIRTLEEIAISFEGVEEAYALQAGREIRILVKPGAIDDLGAMRLSRDIAKTIEDSMQYPGQIQVTVIRETRAVGFAK